VSEDRAAEVVFGLRWKIKVFRHPLSLPEAWDQLKILTINLEDRVTLVWSERVSFYSRQVMVLATKTKTYAT